MDATLPTTMLLAILMGQNKKQVIPEKNGKKTIYRI